MNEKINKNGFVYFMVNGSDMTKIKIGYTNNLDRRIKQFRTSCPNIRCIYSFEGKMKDEKYLHSYFSLYRSELEWFNNTNEVISRWIIQDRLQREYGSL